MVNALRDAAAVLKPGGVIIDIRPAAAYHPEVFIRRGRRRIEVGPIRRDPDADIAAAYHAVRRASRAGLVQVVARRRHRWRARYAQPRDLAAMIGANANWHLPAATRRRIARAWMPGDVLELSRVVALAILRPFVPAASPRRVPLR